MTVLTLKLLGPIQVEQEGTRLHGFRSQKTLALLGYLAAEQRPVSRTYLADLLWADMTATKRRDELRRALHNLAVLMPNCFRGDRRIVQFEVSTVCQVDLLTFGALQAQADIAALTAAVALYRGDFMEDIYLHDCPDFEMWLLAERELWRQKITQVLQNLITYHTHRGDYKSALNFTNRLLSFEPWHEEAHCHQMLLLARTGQRSAALAQYEICCRILAEMLNVEPAIETQRLYERIKASRMSLPHNLPPAPTPFIGREAELAQLKGHLANPDCRLLTVGGLGGIGKSRLALAAAALMAADTARFFLHGVWFISLVGIASADLLVSTIANALNISFNGRTPAETQLIDYLREKEILLLLDNYEHLLPQTGLLRRILAQAPEVKFLVTSRQRLLLREEWLFELAGLAYPAEDEVGGDIERLRVFSAVRLFESNARHVRRHFSLAEAQEDATQICRLVGGMPLALELAAGRLGTLTCAEVVQEIERSLDILAGEWSNVPARHRSLRAMFEASWAALTPSERKVMQRCSVFRDGFERAAGLEITGATGPLLAALVDKSLLHFSPSGRYELHELLRQYAAEKLADFPDDLEATQARHSRYYTTFLARREQPIKGPRQLEILAEIRAEMGNVRVAWQWAVQTGNLEAIGQALETLIFFFEFQGWYLEWQKLFEQTLPELDWLVKTEPQQGRLMGRLLMWSSYLMGRLGYVEKWQMLAQQSFELLHHYGPECDEGMALLGLSYPLVLKGEFAEARRCSSEALLLFQRGDDLWRLGYAADTRGLIAAQQGKGSWPEAENYLQLAEGYIQKLGNPWLLSNLQRVFGQLYLRQGKLEAARQRFQTGLYLARQGQQRWDEGFELLYLGQIDQQLREFQQAKQSYEESILVFRDIGERYFLAMAYYHLGQVCQAEGALSQAQQQLQTSLALRREIEDRPGIVACLQVLTEVNGALGQVEAAERYRAEAQQAQTARQTEQTEG
ncbi:MAG: tetratricopeptide repeat protein [Anaerolineae bacterium]|nr:tetratricopeptide repeat protein [Anaerolineae bacterium]